MTIPIFLNKQDIEDLRFLLLLSQLHLGGTDRAMRQNEFINKLVAYIDQKLGGIE